MYLIMEEHIMKGIILAGGSGTRLRKKRIPISAAVPVGLSKKT